MPNLLTPASMRSVIESVDRYRTFDLRGVLIDVAAMRQEEMLPDSYGVGEEDLREALAPAGHRSASGDVVLVRAGRMRACMAER